jgi:cytochrome b561
LRCSKQTAAEPHHHVLEDTDTRYGSLSITLHWLMLALIAGAYACIELKGNFPKGSETRDLLKQWHFMLGMAVFALVWLSLLARFVAPIPKIEPALPAWKNLPAQIMHLALYALMIGAPVAGWLILSAAGKPIPFLGLELPSSIGGGVHIHPTGHGLLEVIGSARRVHIGKRLSTAPSSAGQSGNPPLELRTF